MGERRGEKERRGERREREREGAKEKKEGGSDGKTVREGEK